MVRISAYLLLLCLSFVPPLAPIVFPYLLPRSYRHTSAFQTLTAYLTLYLPILSMNGILEAFFAATSGVKGLGTQSGVMVASSGAFAGTLMLLSSIRHWLPTTTSTYPHSELGLLRLFRPAWLRTWTNPEVSLVYANGISMLVRIVFAFRHAINLTDSLLGERIRRQIMKRPATRAVAVIIPFAILLRSVINYTEHYGINNTLSVQARVVALGGMLGVACLGLM
jgi:oligosaccharide translocation protein RFT1